MRNACKPSEQAAALFHMGCMHLKDALVPGHEAAYTRFQRERTKTHIC